ncbi:MAG: protein phosphatase 2C domain-containing protein [Actinomycetota bacterium]|nr:protein phosphatase 2C domain-containing protein [Actinomycetota bacterium]
MQMVLSVAGVSALGGRDTNQDSWYADQRLITVADGVGGAPAGDVASRLAVDTVAAAGPDTDLADAVGRANAAVRAHAEAHPDTEGMATTLIVAALVAREGGWFVRGAHVGDSITIVQNDRIQVLTSAHTLAAELVSAGHLTEEEGARHPNRAALVRAVGMESSIRPDVWERPAVAGDRYLLSSDGLTDALGADLSTWLDRLRTADATQCAETLVRSACEAGARDNVTVVIADVLGG